MTLIYRYDAGDGHKPIVSDDGQKVAWGDTDLNVVHVPNPAAVWRIGRGRDVRFLSNDVVTWIRELGRDRSNRFVADLRTFDPNVPPTADDPSIVAGNDFSASDGHWASVLVRTGRLAFDGRVVKQGVRACRMRGRYLLTVEAGPRASEVFAVYHDGVLERTYPLPSDANDFTISNRGWISYGYNWATRIITPDWRVHDITVTPWRRESPARLVHLADGTTWAWTSTERDDTEEPQVLGRPLRTRPDGAIESDPRCVILPNFPGNMLDAGWWDGHGFVVAGSSNLGRVTPLQVHLVPLAHARAEIPPSHPGNPEPEPGMKPGVTIDRFDTRLMSTNTWTLDFHDRNSDFSGRVEFINGSVHVTLRNEHGEDRSVNRRPVQIG